jgi:hypothetical protein
LPAYHYAANAAGPLKDTLIPKNQPNSAYVLKECCVNSISYTIPRTHYHAISSAVPAKHMGHGYARSHMNDLTRCLMYGLGSCPGTCKIVDGAGKQCIGTLDKRELVGKTCTCVCPDYLPCTFAAGTWT